VISAEQLLAKILERAKELALNGKELFATPNFTHFLYNSISREDFRQNPEHLERFSQLDDFDIFTSIKVWVDDDDFILSTLCSNLINRNLYQVEITNDPPEPEKIYELVNNAINKYGIDEDDASYFVFTDTIKNSAYNAGDGSINILMKDGSIQDITIASDNSNLEALAKTVEKHILCYTKDLKPAY
jgi:hypothetical protein